MDFYTVLSDYYDQIFPFDEKRCDFINNVADINNKGILDIGCATGELCLALKNRTNSVRGIDLDPGVIEKAKNKNDLLDAKIDFEVMNMLSINKAFAANSFDIVLCFGNTLVHLNDENEIRFFLKEVQAILKSGGCFVIQIINFDRIINQNISELPVIENDNFIFIRQYDVLPGEKRIDFNTSLLLKEKNKKFESSVKLYPLQSEELSMLLKELNFKKFDFYGDLLMNDFDPAISYSLNAVIYK